MRILLVEDERKIANHLKKGLKQERFAVDIAYNGIDGFDLASTEPYDLIILDLMLPKMDGMEICTKLREEKNKTPILMLTAKNDMENRVMGLNSGADDYLTKPFAFTELLARIKALLRRPSNLISNEIVCGKLKINTQTFEVTRNNTHIKLSRKEFTLLEYLIRNCNRILTKQEITEHVWDYEADILPNTIEVYIGYLRTKIEKPFKNSPKLIKTVRGFGYKLEPTNKNV